MAVRLGQVDDGAARAIGSPWLSVSNATTGRAGLLDRGEGWAWPPPRPRRRRPAPPPSRPGRTTASAGTRRSGDPAGPARPAAACRPGPSASRAPAGGAGLSRGRVHVADRQQPGQRPHAAALQPVGIARAVEPLVMGGDRLGQPGRVGNRPDDRSGPRRRSAPRPSVSAPVSTPGCARTSPATPSMPTS